MAEGGPALVVSQRGWNDRRVSPSLPPPLLSTDAVRTVAGMLAGARSAHAGHCGGGAGRPQGPTAPYAPTPPRNYGGGRGGPPQGVKRGPGHEHGGSPGQRGPHVPRQQQPQQSMHSLGRGRGRGQAPGRQTGAGP